eukprot:gene29191-31091_t
MAFACCAVASHPGAFNILLRRFCLFKPLNVDYPAPFADLQLAVASTLDAKAQPEEVVDLDHYVQPVDRGPAFGGSDVQRLLRSWQYQVSGKVAAASVLTDFAVEHIPHGGVNSIQKEASKLIEKHDLDDTFYLIDLGNVLRMFKAWRAAMPRIVPFYAVKCHPEPSILKLLQAMGTGFDCASMAECDMMLKMGVHPSKIIFAHPCKRPSDIKYAKEKGIQYTTFDTESELHKIAALNPGFKCVLRIRADDPDARVPLGLKYGADEEDCLKLLELAKSLGLNVVGVSFHVGSACKNLATFTTAIEQSKKIFDDAEAMGFKMELLDIGGGFTGHFDSMGNVMFGEIAGAINAAVAQHFPIENGVRVIAEPGRYFAETSSTLMTPVYGHRDRKEPATGAIKQKDYWLTDGLYGSFNCIIYDGQNPDYKIVRSPTLPDVPASYDLVTYPSTLWGPTCDSADVIYKDQLLPQLRNGDWLLFPNAGAYTVAGACDFNGIEATKPKTFYVFSDSAVDAVDEEMDDMIMMA